MPIATRSLALALVLLSPLPALAQSSAPAERTLTELLQVKAYRQAWGAMMRGEKKLDAWIARRSFTATPASTVSVDGTDYALAFACKPHDCGNNKLFVLADPAAKKAYALQVTVKGTPEAMAAPSKAATYRWFGKPGEAVKEALADELQADPNWK